MNTVNCTKHGACPLPVGPAPSPGVCGQCAERTPAYSHPAAVLPIPSVQLRVVRKPYTAPHEWAAMHAIRDLEALRVFVDDLIKRIPCGDCKRDFIAYLESHPIDGDAFEWGWAAHNYVNAKLGRAAMTIEAARALWR